MVRVWVVLVPSLPQEVGVGRVESVVLMVKAMVSLSLSVSATGRTRRAMVPWLAAGRVRV